MEEFTINVRQARGGMKVSRTLKFIKYLLISIAVLAVLLTGSGLLYTAYQKNQARRAFAINSVGGIESLEKVVLGDAEQWISIRGEDDSNPVLLYLHGGPGGSALPALRHYNHELEQYFTIVNWDQRGAGKSYSADIPEESFNIDQFVSDTIELTGHLIERFETEKIYLLGHSWGSIIGLLAAHQRPDLYHAYIGVAQVVSPAEGEAISYRYMLEAAQAAGDKDATRELVAIEPAPYPMGDDFWDNITTQRKWLSYYGGAVYSGEDLVPVTMSLFALEYTIGDFFNLVRGNRSSVHYLWDEMLTINLMEQVSVVEIPVYFLTGRYDYVAPFELVEAFYNQLEAPCKELIWFERSAHSPHFEEPELFTQVLTKKLPPKSNQ